VKFIHKFKVKCKFREDRQELFLDVVPDAGNIPGIESDRKTPAGLCFVKEPEHQWSNGVVDREEMKIIYDSDNGGLAALKASPVIAPVAQLLSDGILHLDPV